MDRGEWPHKTCQTFNRKGPTADVTGGQSVSQSYVPTSRGYKYNNSTAPSPVGGGGGGGGESRVSGYCDWFCVYNAGGSTA